MKTSPQQGINATVALTFLGILAAIQGSDPNIASTALLSAGKDLQFGGLAALAASVSTLALAATVISTGMIADRLGRKKVVVAGILLAIIGDGLVSISHDPWMFILGRTIAGIAMGTIYGGAFAYVTYFAQRTKGGIAVALGIFGASTGLFALLFTFAGSVIVGMGWREAFLVVPLLCGISLFLGLIILPADQRPQHSTDPWDAVGQILLGLALIGTLFGISHAADSLTSPLTVGPVVAGVVFFVLFFLHERTQPEKRFFPIHLLKSPLFLAAIGVGFLYNFTSGVGFLSFSNLFQYQLDLKGLSLSLAQLPYMLLGIPVTLIVGKLISKNVMTRQMSSFIGAWVTAAGAVLFALTAISSPHTVWDYMPALVVLGIGTAIPIVAYGGMILEEADTKHYGVVSSSRSTIGQFWYAMGLASSTVVIDLIARRHVLTKLGSSAESQLNEWSASGAKPTDTSVFPAAVEGFAQGFAVLMIAFAIATILFGFLVLFLANKSDKHKAAAAAVMEAQS
jgi:MFS family permease